MPNWPAMQTYDAIRDSVADLGLPLSRLEQRRHRVEELFRTDPAALRWHDDRSCRCGDGSVSQCQLDAQAAETSGRHSQHRLPPL